jgi:hypothetical protein
MNTFATEREVEQMVGTATPPVTGPPFPALVPATTAGPGRLAAAAGLCRIGWPTLEAHPWPEALPAEAAVVPR